HRGPEDLDQRLNYVLVVGRALGPDLDMKLGRILEAVSTLVVLHPSVRPGDRLAGDGDPALERPACVQVLEPHHTPLRAVPIAIRVEYRLAESDGPEDFGLRMAVSDVEAEAVESGIRPRPSPQDESSMVDGDVFLDNLARHRVHQADVRPHASDPAEFLQLPEGEGRHWGCRLPPVGLR